MITSLRTVYSLLRTPLRNSAAVVALAVSFLTPYHFALLLRTVRSLPLLRSLLRLASLSRLASSLDLLRLPRTTLASLTMSVNIALRYTG